MVNDAVLREPTMPFPVICPKVKDTNLAVVFAGLFRTVIGMEAVV